MTADERTIQRPFHWGIVVIVGDDWNGQPDLPAFQPNRMVNANDFAVVIAVRHAQDSDEVETADDGVEYIKPAEARVVVRRLDSPPADEGRRQVFTGTIAVRSGRVTIGDADDVTTFGAHQGRTRITVSVDADVPLDDMSPDVVYIDLLPGQ